MTILPTGHFSRIIVGVDAEDFLNLRVFELFFVEIVNVGCNQRR